MHHIHAFLGALWCELCLLTVLVAARKAAMQLASSALQKIFPQSFPRDFLILCQARAAMDRIASWTDPTAMLPGTYWPCLGVAARYSAAVKKDPSLGHSRMQAYTTIADLRSEKRHVMCVRACSVTISVVNH